MNAPARAVSPLPSPTGARATLERVAANLSLAVQGKDKEVRLAVTCVVAGGHLLLEDVPGVGKTTLVEALARSFALSSSRIQFTADLMPADILGAQVFHAQTATFTFRPGPLFRQLVLADELNRAPPRTQSALLEAMAQGQVSLDGATHVLPRPFTVVATQNPVDFSGTYPLPDSQLDRFLMRLSLGHPSPEVEARLLTTRDASSPVDALAAASSPEELSELRAQVAAQRLDDTVADYVVRLAQATRAHGDIERGASTRAVLALGMAARAHALWEARDFVTPGDVRAVLGPCLAHRLLLRSATQGAYTRDEAAHLLEEVARKVPAPR
ncbi:MoxR family ATPase [Vitiosangium sp. GDMCC 1.1324]|uniref:AAA family ATPase n=1 Tax=Vitiosangium sp. (strain GDMCC 1.1324) TaxID=2138576 RepID=UPI000D342560|nr:AAA family ATPase [Vitiosangium sp. GDMCC 1.1324]PTL85467.1 ATPase [Vitiosangium sp. GDMCC 1.1324]